MTNLLMHQILGKKDVPGDVGIEVEVEGTSAFPEVHNTRWTSHRDNSLRGFSMEYTNTKPVKLDKVNEVLTELHGLVHTSFVKSRRASVHVHLNILRFTPLELWTAITGYWFVEQLLFEKFLEPSRRSNVFCLRLSDAEGVVDRAVQACERAKGGHGFNSLSTDAIRYSSLNLNAITKFGSVEARGMHSTISPAEIGDWVRLLHALLHNTKRYKTPGALMDEYFRHGPKKVVKDLLPNVTWGLTNADELLERNIPALIEFAYCVDWAEYQEDLNRLGAKAPAKDTATGIDPVMQLFDDMVLAAPPNRVRPRPVGGIR